MSDPKRIEAPVGNYYGSPAVWEQDGIYFMGVEDWDGDYGEITISKEFFDAFVKEFGAP